MEKHIFHSSFQNASESSDSPQDPWSHGTETIVLDSDAPVLCGARLTTMARLVVAPSYPSLCKSRTGLVGPAIAWKESHVLTPVVLGDANTQGIVPMEWWDGRVLCL